MNRLGQFFYEPGKKPEQSGLYAPCPFSKSGVSLVTRHNLVVRYKYMYVSRTVLMMATLKVLLFYHFFSLRERQRSRLLVATLVCVCGSATLYHSWSADMWQSSSSGGTQGPNYCSVWKDLTIMHGHLKFIALPTLYTMFVSMYVRTYVVMDIKKAWRSCAVLYQSYMYMYMAWLTMLGTWVALHAFCWIGIIMLALAGSGIHVLSRRFRISCGQWTYGTFMNVYMYIHVCSCHH